jgi:hypothetical protein
MKNIIILLIILKLTFIIFKNKKIRNSIFFGNLLIPA